MVPLRHPKEFREHKSKIDENMLGEYKYDGACAECEVELSSDDVII